MSASFDGATFGQRDGAPQFHVWTKAGKIVIKKIPGSDDSVIQKISVGLPRLSLVAKCTGAQLTALYGKVKTTGSLVFAWETATAKLESITDVAEQGAGNDVYFATLNFIRASATISTPSTAWLTESGDTWLTETGDSWITE